MSQPKPSRTTTMDTKLEKTITALDKQVDEAKLAIADAAMAGDLELVQRITEATKTLKSICEQLKSLLKPLKKASKELDESLHPIQFTQAPQTRLRITLDLKNHSSIQVIEEDKAAVTLQKFILAVTASNHDKLAKIAQIICGGCGLVSKFPERDFINPKKGTLYAYLPIGTSGWSVKTSTSTKQKAEQIDEILVNLQLPKTSVRVEIVKK